MLFHCGEHKRKIHEYEASQIQLDYRKKNRQFDASQNSDEKLKLEIRIVEAEEKFGKRKQVKYS